MPTQCDTERVGKTMTLTKPALRSSLGDLHFQQSPRSSDAGSGGAERAKQVLMRKARQHKPSFLCKA